MDDSVSLLCPYSTFSIFSKSPSPWCYVESTAQVCVYLAFSKEVILFFHGVEAPFVMPIGWFDSIHGQRKQIFRLYCFQPFPFSSLVPPALFFFLKNSIVETSEISTKTLIPLSFFFLSCICSHPFPWHLKFYSPFVEFLRSNLALHHNINS